jgi:NDP-sugar pyrophosphorylase family protein
MLRVAGRPILERLVLHLAGFGVRRLFFAVNHGASVIEQYFGDGHQFGTQIEYLRESEPLGTGGGLSLLTERPSHPLVVMNGDLVTQADIGALIEFHERTGPKLTVGVRPYVHTVPFGCVTLNGTQVVRHEEKPEVGFTVNAGLYVLEPDLLDRIPRHQYFPLTAMIDDCLTRGEAVSAYEIQDDWIDVGQSEQLKLAREGML